MCFHAKFEIAILVRDCLQVDRTSSEITIFSESKYDKVGIGALAENLQM